MRNAIEVFLNGGVGNQLFGWAAGQTLALRLDIPLILNTSNLSHRGFQLSSLSAENFTISKEENAVYRIQNPVAKLTYRKMLQAHGHFFESGFRFDKRFISLNRSVKLHGYFQSFRYFCEKNEHLRSIILSQPVVSLNFEELSRDIDFKDSIAIHLRRGDYLSNLDFHGIIGEDYYRDALSYTRGRVGIKKIYVFTDDKEEAMRMFPFAEQVISQNELSLPLENIILMSKFSVVIGANSSFSYWAGILNEGGIKIFPKKWFAETSIDTHDLLPRNFVKL